MSSTAQSQRRLAWDGRGGTERSSALDDRLILQLDDGLHAEVVFLAGPPLADAHDAIVACSTRAELRALHPLFEQHQIAYRLTRLTTAPPPHRARTRQEAQEACERLGIRYAETPAWRQRKHTPPATPNERPTRRRSSARRRERRGARRRRASASASSSSDPPPGQAPSRVALVARSRRPILLFRLADLSEASR